MGKVNKSITPGDFFCIPALSEMDGKGFVMARYIGAVSGNAGYLIEVFKKFYKALPADIGEVDTSERLFRPVLCSFNFPEIPRWRVVFHDPDYDRSKSGYQDIVLEFVPYLWVGGEKQPKGIKSEGKGFERSICWRTLHLIFRVNAHLAGRFESDEPYDYHKLNAAERVDAPDAVSDVIALAESVEANLAKQFSVWKKKVKG
ncbi:Imm26 family immunity protein [Pseudomonas sp. SWI6]|uniref:Imm26 family immunity protein n=1 Tax=Pseudomonas sp. SWI6 TaxID=2083051 RepID=UPI000CE5E0BA|nr:Imm26 family immunity protein [Pseudomonas sp. SWI6]AVD85634.1 hypothetical protein C4Q26_00015 [Pseudomonas sp. SWI44]AVD90681.1 hypothetical protein C4Q26_27620 [Pseudomonas sp. SWI44]